MKDHTTPTRTNALRNTIKQAPTYNHSANSAVSRTPEFDGRDFPLCGLYCAISGAYAGCVDGECVIDHCQSGYADCNDDPSDGCEAVVTSGCENRCEPATGAPDPGPSMGSCMCPMGTTCVRGSLENPGGEYCFPPPEPCNGFGNCSCLGQCVCPNGGSPDTCWDEMVIGGMIVNCGQRM